MADDRAQLLEKRAGLALVAAAALALIAANSAFANVYHDVLHWKIGPALPRAGAMSVHQWVADGLMAIFFLLVGLEVKREWYDGRLSTPAERRLPIIAAAAGMAVPALIFLIVAGSVPGLAKGWAIPAATDIAFAIGVLAILGRYAPASIKLLLVTIAIVDDIGAVLIIAFLYTAELDLAALAGALAVAAAMAAMTRLGVRRLTPFMIGFAVMWVLMLASGVHATIAGILTALTIPLGEGEPRSPLKLLEHRIHPWVMFAIVPLFGFTAAGVHLGDLDTALRPLPLAIMLGLFLGKQLGIFSAIWLAVRSGLTSMPAATSWRQLYGAAILCGIGFTMSLFIGALAFPGEPALVDEAKVGTLAGSLLSAAAGYLILRFAPGQDSIADDIGEVGELFGADQADKQ